MPSYPSAPESYPGTIYPGMATDPVVDPGPVVPVPAASAPEPPAPDEPGALAEWAFVVGPAGGGLARELSTARSRKCSFKLGEPSDASCEVDGHAPDAASIAELATDLHVFRAPRRGARKQRLFRGRIGKAGDAFSVDEHTVTVPALDYRAVLDRRRLMAGSQQTWTATDQVAIAQGLVDQVQRLPGGSYGITLGRTAATGIVRDRTYELGSSVGEKIQELAETQDGFDWDITPVGSSALVLDIWYPRRGTDRAVVLELGGAVASGTRTVDTSGYATHVRLTGQAPQTTGSSSAAAPVPVERVASDVAARPEGRFDRIFGEDIVTAAALADRADWRLADSQVIVPSYSLVLKPGWWRGPDHVWLGDPVTVRIRSGRLRVNTVLRVQQIDVAIDDEGVEQVTVAVGAPPPDFRRKANATERRLTTLERR